MARKSRKNTAALVAPQPAGVMPWRAALYIRLSVEFNSKRGDSLETQRQIMEAYLALMPDVEIVEVYTDNGTSGQTFERKAFQRMLDDIEAGKINCVVVKDLSRLGRNTIDTGFYIEKYFPLHRVRFIAVNDQYDSEGADNSGSHITVPLKNMINEVYAADIAKKVRSQQHQSMKDGEFIGARPPYGYKKAPDNCHKLLVNEETAPVVRQIFEWTVGGVPLNEIVKRLNEGGILTPGYYHASCGLFSYDNKLAGSGKWQTWTVARILADEVYTGDMVQGKTRTVGRKQVPTAPEEWIVVRGTHEALISTELFEQAQAARERMAAKYTKTMKNPYSENILRGRIFCSRCGKNLHRQRNHDHYFYRCISNDRLGKGSCMGGVISLAEDDLFHTVLTIIRKEAENVIGKSLWLKQQDGKLAEQKAAVEREIAQLRQDTVTNRRYLNSLFENLANGILTTEEYRSMKADYDTKIRAAVERTAQLQGRQRELERQLKDYTSLADKLAKVDKDTALSALLVDQLIERITVNSPKDISIHFRFESGFEQLFEVLGNA